MRRLALAWLLLLSASAVAQGSGAHLEPDDSIFGSQSQLDYYSNVTMVLRDVVPWASPKAYVLPSNTEEYVVGIDDEEGSCAIVVGRVKQTLWLYESRKGNPELQEFTADFPDDPLDVEVEVESQPVARDFCNRLRQVLSAVLLETRYPDQVRIGLDGVSFHFSTWLRGRGMLNGKIWSPEQHTTPGKLVALTYAMRDFARSGSQEDLVHVQTTLIELERALE